jgi:hypothetical protein
VEDCRSTSACSAVTSETSGATSALSSTSGVVAGSNTSNCSTPQLTQAFLAWDDPNWYALAPGESADNFYGSGWTLGNGANVTTTTLYDGTTGPVLDLPNGGWAISPPVCVESNYPTARTMINEQSGFVGVAVTYAGLANLEPSGILQANGGSWAPSNPFEVHPGDQPGWRLVQFVFGYLGSSSAEIYNFYVDPWMSD